MNTSNEIIYDVTESCKIENKNNILEIVTHYDNNVQLIGFIYILTSRQKKIYNRRKIGLTTLPHSRLRTYLTGCCDLDELYFEKLYKVKYNYLNGLREIETMIHSEFQTHWRCREWFEFNSTDIIDEFIHSQNCFICECNLDDIKDLQHSNDVVNRENKLHSLRERNNQLFQQTQKSNITNKGWYEREYQSTIINFSKNELLLQKNIYIELPTGGGKSYIVYNLFEILKSEFIIIVSPRKIINSQNISSKYLQILKDNYNTFNYSTDNNFDEYLRLSNKKIVVCCTQSIDKIQEKMISNSITNITVWFDEAHWGIEERVDTLSDDKNSQFWLLDNKHINYRIFTSASPNKPKILQNEKIFGKLYSPIKVKENKFKLVIKNKTICL
jgi:hypothetical protein